MVAEDGANLISRSTPLAFIASEKYWVNNHAHILRPMKGNFGFWAALLCVFDYTPWITGAAQPKLTKENLGSLKLPVPPEDEQIAINNFIAKKVIPLDAMMGKVDAAISMLKEYRAALITNAVTGKIDVRNFKVPEHA